MKNPFDPHHESLKHIFYKEITEAINDWMIKKYPDFDTSLMTKLKQVDMEHERLRLSIHEHNQTLESNEIVFVKKIKEQINDFLSKDYPDLDQRLKLIVVEIEKKLKKIEKNSEEVEKKLKTLVNSQCLYEDVYKMRDEFKEIQKFMESFKKKIKTAFNV